MRRARLRVPQTELSQVKAGPVLYCLDEILAGRGLAVMSLEVEVAALSKAFRSRHGSHHEIGRASCRERVCQYVSISVVAGSLKKKEKSTETQRVTTKNITSIHTQHQYQQDQNPTG